MSDNAEGLPPLPEPMRKVYERPHGLQELLYYTAEQVRQAQREAVAARDIEIAGLRRLLAGKVAGALLYCDDGELQDNTAHPSIDFKRDSTDAIATKLTQRAQQPAQGASIDTPEFRTLLDKLVDAAGENVAAFHSARAALIAYIDARRAAVSIQSQALAQPTGDASEGWQLVPVEPTEEMDAAARAECHRMSGVIDPVIHVWDAMLAAAPQSPTTPRK